MGSGVLVGRHRFVFVCSNLVICPVLVFHFIDLNNPAKASLVSCFSAAFMMS